MRVTSILLLAFTGGIFLAIQAGYNTQLSSLVKQPILAVIATSITSTVLGLFLLMAIDSNAIQLSVIKSVPHHLWWIGGLFSMLGILIYFYSIPKLGISKMITLGLCGQIAFSIVAGKFGWFNTPIEPITVKRIIGIIFLLISILLINSK